MKERKTLSKRSFLCSIITTSHFHMAYSLINFYKAMGGFTLPPKKIFGRKVNNVNKENSHIFEGVEKWQKLKR